MRTVVIIITAVSIGVLQSVFLTDIFPMGVVPDITLILLLAASCHYGSMTGTITGFLVGTAFDVMSLAPLGFHAFIYTLIGYLVGLLSSNISSDRFLLPFLLALPATVFKYVLAYLLSIVFSLQTGTIGFITWGTLVEIGVNSTISPVVFRIFLLMARLSKRNRGGF